MNLSMILFTWSPKHWNTSFLGVLIINVFGIRATAFSMASSGRTRFPWGSAGCLWDRGWAGEFLAPETAEMRAPCLHTYLTAQRGGHRHAARNAGRSGPARGATRPAGPGSADPEPHSRSLVFSLGLGISHWPEALVQFRGRVWVVCRWQVTRPT